MNQAAQQLHQLRYLLLEAALPPETAPAWHQLAVRVAEALLDGSTPPAAVPLLAALLQQGLLRQGGKEAGGQEEQADAETAGLSTADQVGGTCHDEGAGLLSSGQFSAGLHFRRATSDSSSTGEWCHPPKHSPHTGPPGAIAAPPPPHLHPFPPIHPHPTNTQSRLVPRIVSAMAPPRPGARPLLREAEGAGLLRR